MTHEPATDSEPELTVEEAADELGISSRAVRHRILAGTIHARKHGRGRTSPYLITRAEVARVRAEDDAAAARHSA